MHEESGFDRMLIGYYSNAPDGFVIASDVFAHTERLGVLLAHRPGFVAPTLAARKLASLDQFSRGRLAVHVISGGSDADQRRDGDFLDMTRATAAPTSTSSPARALDVGRPARPRGRVLPLRGRLAGGAARAAAVPADLLRRLLGRGDRGRGPARRRLRALGRAARGVRRAHRARARRRRGATAARCASASRCGPILGATEEAAWERAQALLARSREQAAAQGSRRPRDPRAWGRNACSRPPPRRGPRHAPVHRDRGGDRCAGQHDGARRHGRAGRRVAAGLRRHRRQHHPAARLRSAGGCARVREHHPARASGGRPRDRQGSPDSSAERAARVYGRR